MFLGRLFLQGPVCQGSLRSHLAWKEGLVSGDFCDKGERITLSKKRTRRGYVKSPTKRSRSGAPEGSLGRIPSSLAAQAAGSSPPRRQQGPRKETRLVGASAFVVSEPRTQVSASLIMTRSGHTTQARNWYKTLSV